MINQNVEITKRSLVIVLLLCILCSLSLAYAGGLPKHYPNAFKWTGTIERVSADRIVIGDREFSISSNVSFNRLNSNNTTAINLATGMTIGCTLSDTGQIISVWELPNSMSNTVGPWAKGLSLIQ